MTSEPKPGGGNHPVAAVTATRHVTLVFPATQTEYEQARAGVEGIVRRNDETLPGLVPTAPAEGADYVATTDAQRRAWRLPDLTCAAREDDGGAVAVMAPCDAIRTLLGGDARGPDSRPEGAVPPAGAEAVGGGARRSVTDIVNLKEGRGRIPSGSRQAFDELSRATQLDAARGKLGAAIELIERKTLPALERSHRTIETLSQRPIIMQRLSEACDTDPSLDPDERLAAVCWAVRRRFDRAERALAPLTSSAPGGGRADAGRGPAVVAGVRRGRDRREATRRGDRTARCRPPGLGARGVACHRPGLPARRRPPRPAERWVGRRVAEYAAVAGPGHRHGARVA